MPRSATTTSARTLRSASSRRRWRACSARKAALFVQSGTMANLAAVMAQAEPGETVLVSPSFHIHDHERDAMHRVARCSFELLKDETSAGETRLLVRECPGARLLCLENTVNRPGGTVVFPGHIAELSAW